jgi:hypothetical protein
VANGQYFARITLKAGKGNNDITIPVAFNKKQGAVTLTHSCTPTTFPTSGSTHCTATVANFAPVTANVDVNITNPGGGLTYANATPAAATIGAKGDSVHWSGSLTPSLPPQIVSITSTTGPAGGYLPLSAFGITPIGAGDDTISNFNVPTFYYGAEAYTRVGVVSNGYLVIGGGTASDIQFVPQTFPNTARPNNTVALLWNDLNPSGGGGAGSIRIATLTDGSTTWLVVDWAAVKNFSNATTHTFETWIRLSGGGAGTGPVSEEITLTYSATANTASPDPGSGGNSGAENRDGTSGKNLTTPANTTEWHVNTAPPAAGGTATIEYDASAKKAGTYTTVAGMTSNVTSGTTQAVHTLTAQ